MARKRLGLFNRPEELPPSRFATNSKLRETPEWKDAIDAVTSGEFEKHGMYELTFSDNTIKEMKVKRLGFNFSQYMNRFFEQESIAAKAHHRSIGGKQLLYFVKYKWEKRAAA